MNDNHFQSYTLPDSRERVFPPRYVREYLQMKGFECVEVVEDSGLIRDILHGKSKLEIMD